MPETIKCISLWQPWATLIAIGAKRIETRGWPTNYRGPIAIHAAKRVNKSEMIYLNCNKAFASAVSNIKPEPNAAMWEYMPLGAIVAVANLVDCRPSGSFTGEELDARRYHEGDTERGEYIWNNWTERAFGDYRLGRFGWVLEDVKALPEPIPYKGEQGLFNVPSDLFAALAA